MFTTRHHLLVPYIVNIWPSNHLVPSALTRYIQQMVVSASYINNTQILHYHSQTFGGGSHAAASWSVLWQRSRFSNCGTTEIFWEDSKVAAFCLFFSGKFGQIIGWCPPPPWDILDPLLVFFFFWTVKLIVEFKGAVRCHLLTNSFKISSGHCGQNFNIYWFSHGLAPHEKSWNRLW